MKPALLIIAQEGYQDRELAGVRDVLRNAGIKVVLCSSERGGCTGKYQGHEEASIAMRDVKVADYGCIAFIGGPGAASLWKDPDATRIARDAVSSDIVLGAICIAPKILAAASVLQGKRATVWDADGSEAAFLTRYGAIVTGEPVTIDGRIVTGNGPDAASAFGEAIVSLISAAE